MINKGSASDLAYLEVPRNQWIIDISVYVYVYVFMYLAQSSMLRLVNVGHLEIKPSNDLEYILVYSKSV